MPSTSGTNPRTGSNGGAQQKRPDQRLNNKAKVFPEKPVKINKRRTNRQGGTR